MRRFGRFLAALIIFSACLLAVLYLTIVAAREFATIWLPLTLSTLVAALIAMAQPSSRFLVWGGMSSGIVLMWMISEPETALRAHPRLVPFALGLAFLGGLFLLILLGKWAAKRDASCGWGVALVLMSWLLAFFSSPSGGSGGMISTAMQMLHLSQSQAELAVLVVRKCIHFSFYGLLGWAAFRWSLSTGCVVRRAVVIGLLVALVHAGFDEGRQTFFPDRTGSAWDVMLDCAGAGVFVWLSQRRRLDTATPQSAPTPDV